MSDSPPWVRCPTCLKNTPYEATNPFRPFCSERCRLVDLGQWAADNYRIPDKDAPPPDEPLE